MKRIRRKSVCLCSPPSSSPLLSNSFNLFIETSPLGLEKCGKFLISSSFFLLSIYCSHIFTISIYISFPFAGVTNALFYYFQNTVCNDKLYWSKPNHKAFLGLEVDISVFPRRDWGEQVIITLPGKLMVGAVQPTEQPGFGVDVLLSNHLLSTAPRD